MEYRISATELARRLGDVLGKVRYRGDSFVVERNGDAVAQLVPVPGRAGATLREAVTVWRGGRGARRGVCGHPGAGAGGGSPAGQPMGLMIDTSALVAMEREDAPWEEALAALGDEPTALPAIVYAELLVIPAPARAAGSPGRTLLSPRSRRAGGPA